MAAGVNPSVKRAGGRQRAAAAGAGAGVGGSGGSTVTEEVAVVKSSRPPTLIWTPEEQSLLEEGLTKYASVSKLSVRYSKIARDIGRMSVVDVAYRRGDKRKKVDQNLSKKRKAKKEKNVDRFVESSAQQNVRSYILQASIDDIDDGDFNDNGGPTGQIFKQNMQAFSRVSANLSSLQTRHSEEMRLENIELLSQARENVLILLSLQNDMNGVSPEIMMKMPPLPVKLNEEIANAILRKPNLPLFGRSSAAGGFNGGADREENHY
ncbi:hypothetical protein QJS10_CPB19g00719 [Acorus calamus]|uniref:Myb-like domain-containing protein n=1 Tax=Acorus calamus TaxID=4465 RepID=A0AAV9CDW9_ACOCL|nr:hypothetical protein QJS10_CPB19g00719 [Acorus calamus]